MRQPILFLWWSGLFVATALAAPVYKSVDAEGNITFSDTPDAGATRVETLDLPPGPSAEQVEQARERIERDRQAGAALERERKAREAERAELEKERREEAERQRRDEESRYQGSEWVDGGWGLPPYRRRRYYLHDPIYDYPTTLPAQPIRPGIPGGGSPAPGLQHMPLGGLRGP